MTEFEFIDGFMMVWGKFFGILGFLIGLGLFVFMLFAAVGVIIYLINGKEDKP